MLVWLLGLSRSNFLVPVRHFALWLNLMKTKCGTGDVEDQAVPELEDNPGKTNGTDFVRFACNFSPVGSTVVSDRFATHKNIRVLLRVFQAIELQAYLRIIAQSRRSQHREHVLVLVLPHLFALLHWLSLPLWGFWISTEFLKSFCSACALKLQNQPRTLVPPVVLKWAPALPWLQ